MSGPTDALPVVFIHGLWLHASSLAAVEGLLPRCGVHNGRPRLAGDPDTVEQARAHPDRLADHGIDDVVAHCAEVIGRLAGPPILIGHSFGGMIAQKLLGQDLAVAAVAIDAAQIKGVLPLPLSALRAIPGLWSDTLGTVELADLGGICAEPVDPLPVSEQSGLLTAFDEAAVSALLGAVRKGPDFVLDVVQVRQLGGPFTRASTADGPAGALDEPFMLAGLAVPVTPEVAERIQATFADVRDAMSPWLSAGPRSTSWGPTTTRPTPSPGPPCAGSAR